MTKKEFIARYIMQYDDAVKGMTAWIDWQQGIKDRIPK